MDSIMSNESDNFTMPVDRHHDPVWLVALRFTVVCIGIVLNILVTVVFVYIKMYKKSLLHGLIVQQSFLDLFGCCTFLFFYNQDAPDGEYGTIFCKARTLFWIIASTSTYNLVVITIERYLAVVHPIWYRFRSEENKSILFYIMFYLIPYIMGTLILFHLGILAEVNEDSPGECRYNYPNRTVGYVSGICIFLLLFFVPSSIMIYCYGVVIWTVRKHDIFRKSLQQQQNRSQQTQNPELKEQNSHQQKKSKQNLEKRNSTSHISMHRNLIFTMLFVVIGFICTSSPNFTLYLVYIICQCFEFSTIVGHEITVLMYTSNMCINPIIYGVKMRDFRNGLHQIWRKIHGLARRDFHPNSSSPSQSSGVTTSSC
ncbi:substance-P receptor-like [Antedon mediterranea]|uniref:substance-P receptor-like n=1 Tax=Antedon mediterranea TaxID=105859 RepID=UPI003AF5A3E0